MSGPTFAPIGPRVKRERFLKQKESDWEVKA